MPSPQTEPLGLTLIGLKRLVSNCLNLPADRLDTIPQADLAKLQAWVAENARSELANLRIHQLRSVQSKQMAVGSAVLIDTLAVAFSMLSFGAGAQILASRLTQFNPALVLPVALLIAALIGYLLTTQATGVITRLSQRSKAIEQSRILRQNGLAYCHPNVLRQSYGIAQDELLRTVESPGRFAENPVTLLLLGVLGLVEYVFTFQLISEAGVTPNTWVKAIASALPLLVLWLAACLQSEWIALPQASGALIPEYEQACFWPQSVTEEEAKQMFCLWQAVDFVVQGDPSGQNYNWSMAKLEAEIEYYQHYKQSLESESQQNEDQMRQAYQSLTDQLPQQFCRQAGWCDQEFRQERDAWVWQETQRLQAEQQRQHELSVQRYQKRRDDCDRTLKKIYQRYTEARWVARARQRYLRSGVDAANPYYLETDTGSNPLQLGGKNAPDL